MSDDIAKLVASIDGLREDIRKLTDMIQPKIVVSNLGSPVWPEEPGMREVDAIFEGAAK